jgi:hypothetical protein
MKAAELAPFKETSSAERVCSAAPGDTRRRVSKVDAAGLPRHRRILDLASIGFTSFYFN